MPQDWLHRLLYALISGITEFLPVSASAHQDLYCRLFGYHASDPLLVFAVRMGALTAVLVGCGSQIKRLLRQYRMENRSNRRRRYVDTNALLDLRLLKTAAIPVLISVLFYKRAGEWIDTLPWLALMLLLGGVVLFLPRLLGQGNKDGRSASRLDSIAMGLGSALAAIPGFSRLGCAASLGAARGMDRNYALEVALLLSVPALLGLLLLDLYEVIAAKVVLSGGALLWAALSAGASFLGGYLSLTLLRHGSGKAGVTGYCYYNWGMALLSFTLYLTI